ncbi:MAG: hypothetical protein JXQ90_19350 [Cyclobacteriaceae bacterium]
MKLLTTIIAGILLLNSGQLFANEIAERDTVVIKLENGSQIVIYTKDKADLEDIEKYDINKMIRDLNQSISDGNVDYVELEDQDGRKYVKDTSIVYQSGDKTARINIGKFSLELDDVEDWDDLEDRWDDIEDWDEDDVKHYTYVDRKIDRTKNSFNIELGTSNWINDILDPDPASNNSEPWTVRPFGSWFVGLNSTNKTWLFGPVFFEWGAGVNWYNWKLEDEHYKIVKGADAIEWQLPDFTGPDPINPVKSKLSAGYLNITMVPVLDFAKGRRRVRAVEKGGVRFKSYKKEGIRIGVGGYAGYKFMGRTKYVFEEGNSKDKDLDKGSFYMNPFRYGVRAQFGWKGLDIFMNYDLNELFANGRGPQLHAYSFGIVL